MSESCAACRFSNTGAMAIDGRQVAETLVCRRLPPTIAPVWNGARIVPSTNVPPVLPTDWCGEFQPLTPAN